jgi:hypothetical protein
MAVDVQGKTFEVGQKVARAIAGAKGIAWVEVQICTKIDGDKVYLNSSKRPMIYPERLCIVGLTTWPDAEM